MKKNFYKILLIMVISVFSGTALSQANSVELRSGNSVLISSHSSIQEAYNAITAPVSQAYQIWITSGYTGANEIIPVTFIAKDGASASNTITIKPAPGVTSVSVTGTISNNAILVLDGADYLVIDGSAQGDTSKNLLIENTITSGTSSNTINLINGATNNVIKNCIVKNNAQNTAGPRGILFGTAANNPEGNSNNSILNCIIDGSRSALASSGTAANPNQNLLIKGNIIHNFSFTGIWLLSAAPSCVIEDNLIYQVNGYASTGVSGINVGSIPGQSLTIRNNKIIGLTSSSASGITTRGITFTGSAGATYEIYNNFISLTQSMTGTATMYYGIYFTGSTRYTMNIYYNTINIAGTHAGGTSGTPVSAAIYKASTNDTTAINIKNNIAVNTRTGSVTGAYHTGIAMATAAGMLDIDYNVTYAAGSSDSYHAYWAGPFNDLAAYKAAASPQEQHTIFKNTNFVSGTDLHLAGNSIGDADLAGIPVQGITTDIDGNMRDASSPYRGADEAGIPVPVELASFSASVNGTTVDLTWVTVTELNNAGFEVQRSTDKIRWISTGFIKGHGTVSEPVIYRYQDAGLAAGKYYYRLKQTDLTGSFEYHNLSAEVNIGIPSEFSLFQNYPNPFNPATRISFALPAESVVTLEVFDILGSKVLAMGGTQLTAGYHSFDVNIAGSSLSSGTYIYRLTASDYTGKSLFTKTMKMSLLK